MPDMPPFPADPTELARFLDYRGRHRLPGLLGIEIVSLDRGRCVMRMEVQRRHEASHGYLHAATVVALADTAAGYGCVASLPDGAVGFTTIELKSNHTSTLLAGYMSAAATMVHGGRTTQVWDAMITAEETGRKIGLFRNTQLILYP
ncbi:MAG: PaaI family thioesterase [Acidimicrobiia bacterium]